MLDFRRGSLAPYNMIFKLSFMLEADISAIKELFTPSTYKYFRHKWAADIVGAGATAKREESLEFLTRVLVLMTIPTHAMFTLNFCPLGSLV